MFKENVKPLTAKDLNCTEDEYNNLFAELFLLSKEIKISKPEITSVRHGEVVTVTITQDMYRRKR